MVTILTHTCQRCGKQFMREYNRAYKYCSLTCRARRPSKLDVWAVARVARQGLPIAQMRAEFNVSHSTMRRALRAYGLYRTWSQHRYLKCASPADGPTSASTASEVNAANTLSARSELRTV